MARFREMTGKRLEPFEVEIIEMLDDLFLKAHAEARNEKGDDA